MTAPSARHPPALAPAERPRWRGRVRFAVLLAIVVVPGVAACGDGGEEMQASPSPTATPEVDAAADRATARTLLLRSSDFPAGWTAAPARRDPLQAAFDDEFAACVGTPDRDTYITADVDSRDFCMGDAVASSTAELVETVEDVTADDVAAATAPTYVPCVERLLTKFLPMWLTGASVGSLTVEPLQIASFGEFSMGWRVTATLTIQGQTVTIYQDGITLGKGRIEVAASFINVDSPFDPALEETLVAALGARLEAA